MIRPARRNGTLVVAVVFPHLFDVAGSVAAVAKVVHYFEAAAVPVLDVSDLIATRKWSVEELVAGPVDPHPSAALHAEVGRALLEIVGH